MRQNKKAESCNAVVAGLCSFSLLGGTIRDLPTSPADRWAPTCCCGAPGEDRTRGLLIRSETLYPLSYERLIGDAGYSPASPFCFLFLVFVFSRAAHECFECVFYMDVSADYVVDCLGNRHLYACLLGQFICSFCCEHTLYNHAD